MTQDTTQLEISEEAFDALYPLVPNHLNPNATWAIGDANGCLFETFGDELDFVRRQDPRFVWTFMDGDGGPYVASGIHFVNRIGYLVSKVPVPDGVFIEVQISTPSKDSDHNKPELDVHALLADRRQVAVVWSIADVQGMRPDLNEDEAWQVLQQCRRVHDCEIGFNWRLIETVADDMFPGKSDD